LHVYSLELDGPALKVFIQSLVKTQDLSVDSLLEQLDPFKFIVDEKSIEEIRTLVTAFIIIP